MKTFRIQAAQGDMLLTKVEVVPDDFKLSEPEAGRHIVTHSETGHNHIVKSEDVDMYASANDEFVVYLVVKNETKLEHLRSFDTHSPISLNPGIYRVNRQREYTPEGYRRAQD